MAPVCRAEKRKKFSIRRRRFFRCRLVDYTRPAGSNVTAVHTDIPFSQQKYVPKNPNRSFHFPTRAILGRERRRVIVEFARPPFQERLPRKTCVQAKHGSNNATCFLFDGKTRVPKTKENRTMICRQRVFEIVMQRLTRERFVLTVLKCKCTRG